MSPCPSNGDLCTARLSKILQTFKQFWFEKIAFLRPDYTECDPNSVK